MTRKRTTRGGSKKAKSQRALAAQLNVSRSTVDRLRKDGLTADRNGHYDVNQARELQRVRALRMRDHADDSKHRREGALQLKEDRLRLEVALNAHKLAVARGTYISKQSVVIEWRRAVIAVKNRFLGLGRELAPHLTGKGPREIQSVIDRRIFEILRLLAHQEFAPAAGIPDEPSTKSKEDPS